MNGLTRPKLLIHAKFDIDFLWPCQWEHRHTRTHTHHSLFSLIFSLSQAQRAWSSFISKTLTLLPFAPRALPLSLIPTSDFLMLFVWSCASAPSGAQSAFLFCVFFFNLQSDIEPGHLGFSTHESRRPPAPSLLLISLFLSHFSPDKLCLALFSWIGAHWLLTDKKEKWLCTYRHWMFVCLQLHRAAFEICEKFMPPM